MHNEMFERFTVLWSSMGLLVPPPGRRPNTASSLFDAAKQYVCMLCQGL